MIKQIPTDIGEYLYYDEDSPSGLRWRVTRMRGTKSNGTGNPVVLKDSVAGTLQNKTGYYRVKVNNEVFQASRVIYSIFHKQDIGSMMVDHINGDRHDNRISNLRLVESSVNNRNCTKDCSKEIMVGVYFLSMLRRGKHNYTYVISGYTDPTTGKRKSKCFNVGTFGLLPAYALACKWREAKIEAINKEGAGYTDRHTKQHM